MPILFNGFPFSDIILSSPEPLLVLVFELQFSRCRYLSARSVDVLVSFKVILWSLSSNSKIELSLSLPLLDTLPHSYLWMAFSYVNHVYICKNCAMTRKYHGWHTEELWISLFSSEGYYILLKQAKITGGSPISWWLDWVLTGSSV